MKRFKTLKSYTLYTLLVAFLFCGCTEHEQNMRVKEVEQWQTIEYDGCEYVTGLRKVAHKGNCKYCTERSKNEMVEYKINLINNRIMTTKKIVNLMLKSSDINPYKGKLSKRDNVLSAIGLAEKFLNFANKGQTNEAMDIDSEKWKEVIINLNAKLN